MFLNITLKVFQARSIGKAGTGNVANTVNTVNTVNSFTISPGTATAPLLGN